ncbi:hypothetical protein SLEP1_g56029 [Rubroshorea leprosula]|uniref:Uncharacterized protein n=1 Tax=Rubroshorea leprosula TaxID=152421 RepID=A0AAV5MJT3_9ROSI|nr:hypothetical protein SLEP1_g56029 [Rubroshorea leprosula]
MKVRNSTKFSNKVPIGRKTNFRQISYCSVNDPSHFTPATGKN